jgi:hypothetical protein
MAWQRSLITINKTSVRRSNFIVKEEVCYSVHFDEVQEWSFGS